MPKIVEHYIKRDKGVQAAARVMLKLKKDEKQAYEIIHRYLTSMKLLNQEYMRHVRRGARVTTSTLRDGTSRIRNGGALCTAVSLAEFTTHIPRQRYKDQSYLGWLLNYWRYVNSVHDVKKFGRLWEIVAGERMPLVISRSYLKE